MIRLGWCVCGAPVGALCSDQVRAVGAVCSDQVGGMFAGSLLELCAVIKLAVCRGAAVGAVCSDQVGCGAYARKGKGLRYRG